MDAYERKMTGDRKEKRADQAGLEKGRDGEQKSRIVVEVIKNRSGVRVIAQGEKNIADDFHCAAFRYMGHVPYCESLLGLHVFSTDWGSLSGWYPLVRRNSCVVFWSCQCPRKALSNI